MAETYTFTDRKTDLALWLVAVLGSLAICVLADLWLSSGPLLESMLIMIFYMWALMYALYRCSAHTRRGRIDPNGITRTGLFRTDDVPWGDIEAIFTRPTPDGAADRTTTDPSRTLHFKHAKGHFSIIESRLTGHDVSLSEAIRRCRQDIVIAEKPHPEFLMQSPTRRFAGHAIALAVMTLTCYAVLLAMKLTGILGDHWTWRAVIYPPLFPLLTAGVLIGLDWLAARKWTRAEASHERPEAVDLLSDSPHIAAMKLLRTVHPRGIWSIALIPVAAVVVLYAVVIPLKLTIPDAVPQSWSMILIGVPLTFVAISLVIIGSFYLQCRAAVRKRRDEHAKNVEVEQDVPIGNSWQDPSNRPMGNA
ncbi:MAG: hypothetical protein JXQ73_31725 [Phycisphaerae bacterium]|nr:hypothetical protein [Phycisphaerae bacterium]